MSYNKDKREKETMKVYMVFDRYDYEGDEFVAVCSSRDRAMRKAVDHYAIIHGDDLTGNLERDYKIASSDNSYACVVLEAELEE